ncbi:hypothetical protein EDB85DRAFT_1927680 [Lactarius pseudohatsudake]|nr:hypothetical protein EDB85DRAFT_1927680 [Lactarius pseudohatsudake]
MALLPARSTPMQPSKNCLCMARNLRLAGESTSPVPSQAALAISQSNASHNVYLGGLDDGQLYDD